MNKELEVRPVTPTELVEELEALLEQLSDAERKYQLQAGTRDVEFAVDAERAQDAGVSFPLSSLDQAEDCLCQRLLTSCRSIGYIVAGRSGHQPCTGSPRRAIMTCESGGS